MFCRLAAMCSNPTHRRCWFLSGIEKIKNGNVKVTCRFKQLRNSVHISIGPSKVHILCSFLLLSGSIISVRNHVHVYQSFVKLNGSPHVSQEKRMAPFVYNRTSIRQHTQYRFRSGDIDSAKHVCCAISNQLLTSAVSDIPTGSIGNRSANEIAEFVGT